MKSRICWRIARGVLAVLMVLAAPTIGAEEYPSKPIRFAIGFPAGSGADITYRPIIDRVSQTIGQSIVIEPHPGGGGMVIARYLKGQPADGYAIALATASVVNSALRSHGDIDLRRDYTPIVPLTSLPLVIAVNSDVKANSLKELLDLVRANPGKYNYASFGVGSG
jgi:tripartite-type tricarboxylate transporter receptor subunit TctC